MPREPNGLGNLCYRLKRRVIMAQVEWRVRRSYIGRTPPFLCANILSIHGKCRLIDGQWSASHPLALSMNCATRLQDPNQRSLSQVRRSQAKPSGEKSR